MKLKEKIEDFILIHSDCFLIDILEVVIMVPFIGLMLLGQIGKSIKKEKPIFVPWFYKCHYCGQKVYGQINRESPMLGEWEADNLVCFNRECEAYGKPFSVVYDPSMHHPPFGRPPEKTSSKVYDLDDPNIIVRHESAIKNNQKGKVM